jgi:hypothetical protein
LGASGRPAQRETDPVATRVLSRGDAIAAPPGRADNFAWPRADADANGAVDVAPVPPPAAPKGAASKNDTNKSDANKSDAKIDAKKPSDAKNQPAPPPAVPGAAPAKPRRTGAELDGAPPRPPLPVGPAANAR